MLPRNSSQEAQSEEYSWDFLSAMEDYRLVGNVSSPEKRGTCSGILILFRAQYYRMSTSTMLAMKQCSRSAAAHSAFLKAGAMRNVSVLVLPVAMNRSGAANVLRMYCTVQPNAVL